MQSKSKAAVKGGAKPVPRVPLSGRRIILIVLGVVMISIAIHFFLLPSQLSFGGATGMALILSRFLPLQTGALLIIVNAVLFVMGFLVIGNAFGSLTVIASLGLSGLVWLLEHFIPMTTPIVEDLFLNLVIAVILYGSGVAIVLNQSASTGGSDIIAKILNKFFGLDLGKGCLITDFIVTLFAGFTFGLEIGLYSLIGVIANGMIIDKVIDGMNTGKFCVIYTKYPDDVAQFLISLGRSATLYEAMGAYSRQERIVLETVVSTRDYIRLKNYLREKDSDVFMVVSNVHNIIGFHWKDIND